MPAAAEEAVDPGDLGPAAGVGLDRYARPRLGGNRSLPWRLAWYLASLLAFESALPLPSAFKAWLLRLFGARVGRGLVIKPRVSIKYPWFLALGDHVWIGERVWIDNVCEVRVGDAVCLSQGAYLVTGNHDWRDPAFAFFGRPIVIGDGAWLGAMTVVAPGSRIGAMAVLCAGAVLHGEAAAAMIHVGNPARPVRRRFPARPVTAADSCAAPGVAG